MVIFAEVVRAGVASLPRGQREAALATGLTNGQTMRIVLLPQAFRVMLPAIISQLVVVLKDTSLVTFIANYDELLSQGESIRRNLDNPIQTFVVVALLYIAINYSARPARAVHPGASGPRVDAGRARRPTPAPTCPSAAAPDGRAASPSDTPVPTPGASATASRLNGPVRP